MKARNRLILRVSCGGMFLSCFGAWQALVFAGIAGRPVSLFEAALVLSAAALVQTVRRRKRWRPIGAAGLHAAGLLLSFQRLVEDHFTAAPAFWRLDRAAAFYAAPHAAMDWVALFFLAVCAVSLWVGGVRLAERPPDGPAVRRRFDGGLACLLLLLLIRLLVAVKGAVVPGDPSPLGPVSAFFVLGLLSMGLVRLDGSAPSGRATYATGAGVVLSFTVTTLLLGGGLFALFLPELTAAAEVGFSLLGKMKTPLENLVIFLARLYVGRSRPPQTAADSTPGIPETPAGDGGGLAGQIVAYLLAVPVVLAALAAFAFVLLRVLQWVRDKLFSKGAPTAGGRRGAGWIAGVVERLRRLLAFVRARVAVPRGRTPAAKALFVRLLGWGRHSGLVRGVCETPAEYGNRLGRRFPQVQEAVAAVVRLHEAAVYAEAVPGAGEVAAASAAMRKLRHPRLWAARLKLRLFGGEER